MSADLISSVVMFGHRTMRVNWSTWKYSTQFYQKLIRSRTLNVLRYFRVLNADTLEIRRIKVDLLFYCKICYKLVDFDNNDLFIRNNSNTCEHNFKITKNYFKVTFDLIFFCNRSVSVSNDLPKKEWVSCDSVLCFKRRLKRYDLSNTVCVLDKLFCVYANRLTICT